MQAPLAISLSHDFYSSTATVHLHLCDTRDHLLVGSDLKVSVVVNFVCLPSWSIVPRNVAKHYTDASMREF